MNKNNLNKKRLLAIETSCDETGICLLSAAGSFPQSNVQVIANELASQASQHQEYGGVFPSLAKRLHAENLPILLERLLTTVDTEPIEKISEEKQQLIHKWLERHDGLADELLRIFSTHGLPALDSVAVTVGPGLEPALWVGINVARAIALIGDVDIIPVNHMEGHLISGLAPDNITNGNLHDLKSIDFSAVGLLVSGGHTELISLTDWQTYEKIGQTRDDAAGEAFDKIGRLLGLPYPAGPQVSALAEEFRNSTLEISNSFTLPRPMLNSEDLDFSFSGLKTAAARQIKKSSPLSAQEKQEFAYELEEAIVDVLTAKTKQAIMQTKAETLLVGGGVSANQRLRTQLKNLESVSILISPPALTGDNAVMIALAALNRHDKGVDPTDGSISAESRLSL